MADFENKAADLIKEMMTDPVMSEKVKDIMNMLGSNPLKKSEETQPNPPSNPLSNIGGLGGLDINMATIQKIKKVYDSVINTEDPRINLLNSLRPYLNTKRLKNLDNAMKIVQISKFTNIMGEVEKI